MYKNQLLILVFSIKYIYISICCNILHILSSCLIFNQWLLRVLRMLRKILYSEKVTFKMQVTMCNFFFFFVVNYSVSLFLHILDDSQDVFPSDKIFLTRDSVCV